MFQLPSPQPRHRQACVSRHTSRPRPFHMGFPMLMGFMVPWLDQTHNMTGLPHRHSWRCLLLLYTLLEATPIISTSATHPYIALPRWCPTQCARRPHTHTRLRRQHAPQPWHYTHWSRHYIFHLLFIRVFLRHMPIHVALEEHLTHHVQTTAVEHRQTCATVVQ